MLKLLLALSFLLASPAFAEQIIISPEPTLIKGTPADPSEWPASVYAQMGNSRCTATVVGESVLLIAAHCVSNGATASFSVGPHQYSSKCTHSPNYKGNATADWALCQVNGKVSGIKFEIVNTDPELYKVGDELLLTGYGCIRPGGGGGNDGTYRIGKAKIKRLPSGNDNDIVTYQGAALCFGDSGGPAFFVKDADRFVVSVNSRGDISTTSYLVAVATNQFTTFSKDWLTKTGLKICGLSKDATNCRASTPPLPEGKDFEIDTEAASLKGTVKAQYLDYFDNIVSVMTEFLNSFKE